MNEGFYTVRGYELQASNKNQLTSAMEDYLEMIYRNSLYEKCIRINVLAGLLNVRDSSASKMVKKLGELGLVDYEKYGAITLTNQGRRIGEFLLKRHKIVEKFLIFIGCKEDVLVQAELIEHIVTAETIKNLNILDEFFNQNVEILGKYIEYRKEEM